LHLSRTPALSDTNLSFSIGTDANSNVVAGSSVSISPSAITNTSGGVSFQDYDVIFTQPVGPFVAGTTYYFNFECEALNNGKVFLETSGGSAYANGIYYRGGSAQADDLVFELWGQ
jgi:hypothetical protein